MIWIGIYLAAGGPALLYHISRRAYMSRTQSCCLQQNIWSSRGEAQSSLFCEKFWEHPNILGKKSAQSETGHPHPSCSQQIKVCFTVPTPGCSEPTRWTIFHLTVASGISWQRAQVLVTHEQEITHRTHLYTVDETLESLSCSNFFFFMYLF